MSSSKRKLTSDIWLHFEKLPETTQKSKCKYCEAKISCIGKNTTNMWNHVKKFHSDKILEKTSESIPIPTSSRSDEPPTKKQTTLTELFEKNIPFATNDPRAIAITKLIAEMICVDMQPLNMVNHLGFNRLIAKVCPKYKMPSRTHFSENVIPEMYELVKKRILRELQQFSHLCLTTDLWTSDSSSNVNDFISFTAHGVTNDFQYKSICLEVMPYEGETHSAQTIAENIYCALQKWEITDKIESIVTDNASNISKAVQNLDQLISNSKIEHIPCTIHTVHLMLKNSLFENEIIKNIIEKSRKIVGHFRHSTKAMKLLRASQEEHNVPKHVLIQDVTTRWNSTYYMLCRLYEQRVAIQAVLLKTNCDYEFSTQEWKIIDELTKMLSVFEDLTNVLSKDMAKLSEVIPIVTSMFRLLESTRNEETATSECVKLTASALYAQLQNRFGEIENNMTYAIATALDPRFKTRTFRQASTSMNVKTALKALCNERRHPVAENEPIDVNVPSASQSSSSKSGIWDICKEIIEDTHMNDPLVAFQGNN